jgi:transcriptional regulator with XRE-family HTH domain
MGKKPAFGQRLRAAREARGVTRKQLADVFRVAPGTIVNWETKGTQPTVDLEKTALDWIEQPSSSPSNATDSVGAEDESPGFSDWLRTQRAQRNLTREALAARANLSPQAIFLIETGRVRNPWRQTRERLMKALGETALPADVEQEIEEQTQIAADQHFNDFSPWEESTIPETGCVYVYYDRTERPIYVGETNNLRARNRQHAVNHKWFFPKLVESGAYVRINSVEERKRLEKLLIQFLRRNFLFNTKDTRKAGQWDEQAADD